MERRFYTLCFIYAFVLISFGILSIPGLSPLFASPPGKVVIKKVQDKYRVEIDGKLFTEYLSKGFAKPILYPVIGPYSIPMTRNYPMKNIKGESHDHIHQKSLWYTHGSVNGIDFWGEGKGSGHIVQEKVLEVKNQNDSALIKTEDKWISSGGKAVCTDTRTLTFSTLPVGRVIDFEITIKASEGDLLFGDTKEGTMGIRTNPRLRLSNDKRRGVTTASGHALNSEGVTGKAVWGKRADWVDYWASINGKTVGIAIFDYPKNPRHPTWWHARDYGLIAANPFGVHYFEGKPKGTGDMKIPAGKSVTFRYRFVFHSGDTKQAKIKELYKQFADK